MVTLDCNNPALARSLNPTRCFNCFYENDLKSGIIDDDSKDTGQEGFDADDAQKIDADAQKIMEDMKKFICQIVYPEPCTNLQLKITLTEDAQKTTVKPKRPKQKRAEKNKNKNKINFMLRPMKR